MCNNLSKFHQIHSICSNGFCFTRGAKVWPELSTDFSYLDYEYGSIFLPQLHNSTLKSAILTIRQQLFQPGHWSLQDKLLDSVCSQDETCMTFVDGALSRTKPCRALEFGCYLKISNKASSSTTEGLPDLGLSSKQASPSLKRLNQFCATHSLIVPGSTTLICRYFNIQSFSFPR